MAAVGGEVGVQQRLSEAGGDKKARRRVAVAVGVIDTLSKVFLNNTPLLALSPGSLAPDDTRFFGTPSLNGGVRCWPTSVWCADTQRSSLFRCKVVPCTVSFSSQPPLTDKEPLPTMPLGLLAKDSIADLEAFAARAEAASSSDDGSSSDQHMLVEPYRRRSGSNDDGGGGGDDDTQSSSPQLVESELATANPQQAQEEDDRRASHARAGPQPPQSQARLGRRSISPSSASASVTPPSSTASSSSRPTTTTTQPNYYHGFDTYSKEYYYHDSYAPMYIGEKQESKTGFWECLFPCLKPSSSSSIASDPEYNTLRSTSDASGGLESTINPSLDPFPSSMSTTTEALTDSVRSTNSRDDDEVSTNSDILGERLSEKERQAVLARLGLAQPDGNGVLGVVAAAADYEEVKTMSEGGGPSTAVYAKAPLTQRGLLNGIPAYDMSPLLAQPNDPLPMPPNGRMPVKGILKRRSAAAKDSLANSQAPGHPPQSGNAKPQPRRSLFPVYEPTALAKSHCKHVTFAPMARVVAVKSKNEMDAKEKADVWFQKSDYEDFRKTGRIITKAMLEGGSEIWLTSSLRSTTDKSHGLHHPKGAGGTGSGGNMQSNKENPPNKPPTGDKWWHKFGHSRRGLEHIVSYDEGRQRQSNVRNAIHAVLEEQARQRRYRREDPEKLRIISLNHTNWARDLALAAGASDADAVTCSFAEDRKSREFFLLKMARSDPAVITNERIPQFMQPSLHTPIPPSPRPMAAVKSQRLDAHTAAQMLYRQEQQQQQEGLVAVAPVVPPTPAESSEPIRDPKPDDRKTESMAQRAKGFISEGAGKVDMSAVLSGLGVQATATVAS